MSDKLREALQRISAKLSVLHEGKEPLVAAAIASAALYVAEDIEMAIALAGSCATTSLTPVAKRLYYELEGVVQDVQNSGFDDVCLETIKRVQSELAMLSAEKQQSDTSHVAGGKPEADTSLDGGLLAAEAQPQNEAIRATDAVQPAWKVGNEYAPYHPSASHVQPEYRDGWNACYYAAIAATKEQQP